MSDQDSGSDLPETRRTRQTPDSEHTTRSTHGESEKQEWIGHYRLLEEIGRALKRPVISVRHFRGADCRHLGGLT